MARKKLKRSDLATLARQLRPLPSSLLDTLYGLGTGTQNDPYSMNEFLQYGFSDKDGVYVTNAVLENGSVFFEANGRTSYISKEYVGGTDNINVVLYNSGSYYSDSVSSDGAGRRVQVSFYNKSDARCFAYSTLQMLFAVGDESSSFSMVITSTARTPEKQASVMYENILRHGVAYEKSIYKKPGRDVIACYDETLSKEDNISRMTEKIYEVGPSNVSRHCCDYTQVNTFDIALSSLANKQQVKHALESKGCRVLEENGCLHVERPLK